ncbi:hypothetical protein JCM39194_08650 [Desulfotomaculum varum]
MYHTRTVSKRIVLKPIKYVAGLTDFNLTYFRLHLCDVFYTNKVISITSVTTGLIGESFAKVL